MLKYYKAYSKQRYNYSKINSATTIVADDEPYEVPEFEQEIALNLEFNIIIEDDGSWDFADPNCDWAEGDGSYGDWYSDEYNVYIGDKSDIAEAVYDLMTPQLTITPGEYAVTGHASLIYKISNVYQTSTYVDRYEEDDPGVEFSNDTDSAYVDLDFDKSKVTIDYYLIEK